MRASILSSIRLARFTKSSDTSCSAPWTVIHQGTDSFICANDWARRVGAPNRQLALRLYRRSTPRGQPSAPFGLYGVTSDDSSQLQADVVVKTIVNSTVQPGHRLLLGDTCELGALRWEVVPERRVERAGTASVAGRKRRKV